MLPEKFVLHQNFPNPFNPATTIRFEVPAGWNTPLTLQIFNLQGQLVKTLIDDVKLSPGTHSVVWDGKDTAGKRMPSGIYFSRVTSDHFIAAKKMLLAR
jgi:flagellar hook assembly protein FlgD